MSRFKTFELVYGLKSFSMNVEAFLIVKKTGYLIEKIPVKNF
jgi:hypothetical protein